MTSSDTLVRIRDLRFRFGPRVIFDGADFDIARGKVTAVMGPSGIGKTTLLRLIGGQFPPETGTLAVDGIEVPKLDRRGLFELRKRMGMMFQFGACSPTSTCSTTSRSRCASTPTCPSR